MPSSRNGPHPRKRLHEGEGGGTSRARVELGLVTLAALAVIYMMALAGPTIAFGADPQMEAVMRQGIPQARASQAIAVQSEVARTELIGKVTAALGSSAFAGVWFEPTVAKFYIGVTSAASRHKAKRVVAAADMTADVVIMSVHSTWAELLAAQEQWNKEHEGLFASSQAVSGILAPRNAVLVQLSSSLSSIERVNLEAGAAAASVNILVTVVPPSLLRVAPQAKKTCIAKFVKRAAYCEEAITSGVSLAFAAETNPTCTSGPMLISGSETFMLTAGHCFNEGSPVGGTSETKAVKSKFTTGGLREIGNEDYWYQNKERDMGIVKVKSPSGELSEALPVPVPAVMAEWGLTNSATPHAVNGQEKAANVASGQTVCREGQNSGEHCGQIKALNVKGAVSEHLVETTVCGEAGDSGGPYFFRTTGGEIKMLGIHIDGTQQCSPQISTRTDFEPLEGLQGAEKYGILNTFTGKSLLTTANEKRP
jgi:Trypsin